MVTKKSRAATEGQSHTCPNPLCGRVFANPLKAENLGLQNHEAYYACPYCLTEITLEKNSTTVEKKQKVETKKIKSELTKAQFKDEETAQPSKKMQGCAYHFGYLSERSEKGKIPEECIVCENIVQCMLKNVAG